MKIFLLLVLITCVHSPIVHSQHLPAQNLPAYTEAEGSGASSRGGRGGRIIEVTNLNNSGSGSLRSAIDASGPRIVIFRVGGIINVTSTLTIRNPYITIAGHTAPGGGILLNGKNTEGATLVINSHDVVLRFLRIRNGSGGGTGEDDAIGFFAGYNNIIDHCSVSWSNDENISTWAWDHQTWGEPKHSTWSYNLIAEGILDHSKGLLTGASSNAEADNMENIDIHHNMYLHHFDRNPFAKHKSGRIVNNIAYNWSGYALSTYGGVHFDIIRNLFKPGPDYDNSHAEAVIGMSVKPDAATFDPDNCPSECPYLFAEGNKGPRHQNPDTDHWQFLSDNWGSHSEVSTRFKRTSALPPQNHPITAYHVSELENHMLPIVGASHRLNEFGEMVPNRDAVDSRLINDYINGTGSVIFDESEVGGLPSIAAGTPYPDSDHDGMSDIWEISVGLNANDSGDGNLDRDGDGMTNIEEFLDGKLSGAQQQPVIVKGVMGFTLADASLECTPGTGDTTDTQNADLAGIDESGTSDLCDTEGDTPALETPSGLYANVYSARAVEIFWDRPAAPGLIYEVRRDGTVVSTLDGTSYFDDSFSPGQSYIYEVIAIDPQGLNPLGYTISLETMAE